MAESRPLVLCIIGFEWAGGCRSVELMVSENTAEWLRARGFSVMTDPWASVEALRWDEEHRWIRSERQPWNVW